MQFVGRIRTMASGRAPESSDPARLSAVMTSWREGQFVFPPVEMAPDFARFTAERRRERKWGRHTNRPASLLCSIWKKATSNSISLARGIFHCSLCVPPRPLRRSLGTLMRNATCHYVSSTIERMPPGLFVMVTSIDDTYSAIFNWRGRAYDSFRR